MTAISLCLNIHESRGVKYPDIAPKVKSAELEIEVPSIEEFYSVANDIKDRFSDIIETFEASLVSQEHAWVQA